MSNQWFVDLGDAPRGPLSDHQLKQLAVSGELTPATRIRLGADGQWKLASAVKGLFPAGSPQPGPGVITVTSQDGVAAASGVERVPASSAAMPEQAPASRSLGEIPEKGFSDLGEWTTLRSISVILFIIGLPTVVSSLGLFFPNARTRIVKDWGLSVQDIQAIVLVFDAGVRLFVLA